MSAPNAKDLLAAYRAERGPTRVEADQLWERLQADVARPSKVRRIAAPPADPGRGRVVAIAAVVLAAAAVAVLALRPSGRRAESTAAAEPSLSSHEARTDRDGATSEASSASPRPEPAPEPTPEPTPAPADAEVEPAPAIAIPTPASGDAPAPARRPASRKHAPAAPRPSSEIPPPDPPATDSLAEETGLIRRARAALSEGRPSAALEILRDYDRRFDAGRLAEEADAVRTMARCRQAPGDPRALAEAFVARHPGSLFRKQVDAACAE